VDVDVDVDMDPHEKVSLFGMSLIYPFIFMGHYHP